MAREEVNLAKAIRLAEVREKKILFDDFGPSCFKQWTRPINGKKPCGVKRKMVDAETCERCVVGRIL